MTVKQRNILKTYWQATADELRDGNLWYQEANEEADRLADENGLEMEQTAAMIAAVSPGMRWERNVECAERIILGEPLDGLGVRWYDGVKKAKRILRNHNPMDVLKGNKVRAFFACILNPDNRVSCCIDGHAYGIWCGKRIPLDEIPPINDRLYFRIASDYCVVARDLAISPCQLQAITWVTWRRLHQV